MLPGGGVAVGGFVAGAADGRRRARVAAGRQSHLRAERWVGVVNHRAFVFIEPRNRAPGVA